jgi:hypothetical protein
MKVAVCISGSQRKVSLPLDVMVDSIRKSFPFADFYYHTWKGYRISNKYKTLETTEPVINYHPILDNLDYLSYWKELRPESYNDIVSGKAVESLAKHQHASKQILAHAILVDSLTKSYDMIVRARWDINVSNNVNFLKLLEQSYSEGPYGFEKIDIARNKIKFVGTETIIPKTKESWSWYKNIGDFLIMHKPEHFDTKYAYQLHSNCKLWSGQPGWYQVLSQPYNDHHTSLNNGLYVIR